MAYTYNDVQNSKANYALEEASSDTTDEGSGLDVERWAALQKSFMPGATAPTVDLGTGSVVSAAEQGLAHLNTVSQAAVRLSEAQSVANVHILNDNFIRDSITGK